MSREKSLAINTAIIFLGKASSQIVGVLLLPLYTFSLSPEIYGYADLLLTYVVLLTPLCSIQLEMATFRYLIDERGDRRGEDSIIGSTWTVLLVIMLIVSALGALIVGITSLSYGIYAVLAVVVGMILSFFQQIARGLGKVVDFAVSGIITVMLTVVISALFLLVFDMGIAGVMLGVAGANSVGALYLFFKLGLRHRLSLKVDRHIVRRSLRYSAPLVPSAVSWWVIGAFGRTIISLILGVASSGVYAVAHRFTMLFSGVPYVFSLSWTESASLTIDQDDRDVFFSRMANVSLGVFCLSAVAMLLATGLVFDWLIAESYRDAYGLIPFLIMGLLANAMASFYHGLLTAQKDTRFIGKSSVVAAVISVATSVSLIWTLGVYGVAMGAMAGYVVMLVWSHLHVRRQIAIDYNIFRTTLWALLLAVAWLLYYVADLYMLLISLIALTAWVIIWYRDLIYKSLAKIKRYFRAG